LEQGWTTTEVDSAGKNTAGQHPCKHILMKCTEFGNCTYLQYRLQLWLLADGVACSLGLNGGEGVLCGCKGRGGSDDGDEGDVVRSG
jgi:hypothetical protein